MKQINFDNLNEKNEFSLTNFLQGGMNMEFIKKGQNYLIKDSGGKIVSEKEKLQLEKDELIFKDVDSSNCQKETTKKISKINKKLKQLDDTIQETDKTV